MSMMDKLMIKAQQMRSKVEQKTQMIRAKVPFAAGKQMKFRKGPKITIATVKNRQVRTILKNKFPALRGMKLPDLIGSRRGMRSGVPLFPLIGAGRENVPRGSRQAPKIVDDIEPRPSSNNISIEM